MPLKNFTYRDGITFTRLTVIGFTWTLPLLGNFVAQRAVVLRQTLLLLFLATAFHIFAYVTNDIVDLELDRLVPRRATKPLIRGAILPQHALWFALSQLPLMLLATYALHGGWQSYLLLLLSLFCMTVYNLFGKKTDFPILTDFIQGIAWALLALYGYTIARQPLQPAAYAIAGFIVIYIMLINGIHGSIRDLPTDAAYGVRSTALRFGASFVAPDKIHLPWSLRLYAAFLQFLLVALSYLAWAAETAAIGSTSAWIAWALCSLLACGLFIFLLTQSQITKLSAVGTLQAISAYWCILFAVLGRIGPIGWVSLVLVYFAPTLLSDWLLPSFSGQLDLKTVPASNVDGKNSVMKP
jgi:4-hydroxybenzoate polyprenyltransferase